MIKKDLFIEVWLNFLRLFMARFFHDDKTTIADKYLIYLGFTASKFELYSVCFNESESSSIKHPTDGVCKITLFAFLKLLRG